MIRLPLPRRRGLRCLTVAGIVLGVGFCGLITVRAAVAEVYRVPTDRISPEIPRNARVVVSRIGRTFAPGDIVAYHVPGAVWLGRVERVDGDTRTVTISANDDDRSIVAVDDIVGRVILQTR